MFAQLFFDSNLPFLSYLSTQIKCLENDYCEIFCEDFNDNKSVKPRLSWLAKGVKSLLFLIFLLSQKSSNNDSAGIIKVCCPCSTNASFSVHVGKIFCRIKQWHAFWFLPSPSVKWVLQLVQIVCESFQFYPKTLSSLFGLFNFMVGAVLACKRRQRRRHCFDTIWNEIFSQLTVCRVFKLCVYPNTNFSNSLDKRIFFQILIFFCSIWNEFSLGNILIQCSSNWNCLKLFPLNFQSTIKSCALEWG